MQYAIHRMNITTMLQMQQHKSKFMWLPNEAGKVAFIGISTNWLSLNTEKMEKNYLFAVY